MNILSSSLQAVGLGDGEGNVSSMRVIVLLVVLYVLVPPVMLSLQSHALVDPSPTSLGILASVLGAKLVQNQQETRGANPSAPSTPK